MKICIILILLTFRILSQTNLSREIKDKILTPKNNPYIISSSIIIKGTKPTIIKAGCIFLFKPFTELDIQGPILIEGTQDSPVVFTSINDFYNEKSQVFPNIFDWNGILIRDNINGSVLLKNFIVSYSVYGIKSSTANIVIEKGLFKNNGQFHFTIKDKIENVLENTPYSYSPSILFKQQEKNKSNKALKVTMFSTGFAGIGAMGCFFLSANKFSTNYLKAEKQNDIKKFKNNRDLSLNWARTSGICGGALVVISSTIIILEKSKKINKRLSFFSDNYLITLDL